MKTFRILIILLLTNISSLALSKSEWQYVGVLGSGNEAIAIVSKGDASSKTFVRIGQLIPNTNFIVEAAARNQIKLKDQSAGITTTLSSQGASYSDAEDSLSNRSLAQTELSQTGYEAARQAVMDSDEDQADERFETLLDLGEQLVESGDLTVEEVNNLLAEDHMRATMIERMNAAVSEFASK